MSASPFRVLTTAKPSPLLTLSRVLWLLAIILLLAACNRQSHTTPVKTKGKPETALEHAHKHLDKRYVCPMHPNIIKEAPVKRLIVIPALLFATQI